MMNKHQIARVLTEMAAIFEIRGENPFKVRAYQNAARIMEGLGEDLDLLIAEDRLIEIKGIGKNLADHIKELHARGTFQEYEEIRTSIPEGLLEMLDIPGVGAKKVRVLWKQLKITTIEELEKACQLGRVATIEGFGARSQERICEGIQRIKQYAGRHLLPTALRLAEKLVDALRSHRDVIRVELAGSLRRHAETVKDIDLVVATKKFRAVAEFFVNLPEVHAAVARGETKVSVMLDDHINADLRLVADREYPYALHHFTGSKAHNVALRSRAKDRVIKVNEYGLFRGKEEKLIPCKDEAEVYRALGLSFIPPELREDMGEIEAAEQGRLPKLVEWRDLKGCLHNHSTYSDGRATIEEMALAASALGFSYIGISDHSKSAAYAGGMQVQEIAAQHREIDAVNAKLVGIRVLKGIEVDILADGSLDYDDDTLKRFEFVIASVHQRFEMSEKEMTARICKALAHPLVDVLAHPTGRLLLSREGYKVDMPRIIAVAAEHGKAIELNANPQRFDIDWRFGPLLKAKKVKVLISPDAHAPDQLEFMRFGLGMARKAWLEKGDVVNCFTSDQLLTFFKKHRREKG